jgi:hypothetical protein
VPSHIVDYSTLAQQFPRHSGPTTLFLNFDGWSSGNVAAFQSTTGDRDRDIQEITYRTAEMFAPFDVQVQRLTGNGQHSTVNGNTTIFIGDDFSNGFGTLNKSRAYTPGEFSDHPGIVNGYRHVPNSNPHDIAFVDPLYFDTASGTNTSKSNTWISQSIAHEAGHTFGLVHVLSSPSKDVMSYDSANQLFVNQTFNITDRNSDSTSESVLAKWLDFNPYPYPEFLFVPTTMETQNSFTFLSAVLGTSTPDDFADVAHRNNVDSGFVDGLLPTVAAGANRIGTINSVGDYDVFQFNAWTTQTLTVNAQRVPGASVNPLLMIYQDDKLVAFNDNRTSADTSSRLTFTFRPYNSYRIVVGGSTGALTGRYRLWINVPTAANPDRSGPQVTSAAAVRNGLGVVTHFLVTFNEDINPATFTTADVRIVTPSGTLLSGKSVVAVSGTFNRQFRVNIPSLESGNYTLRIGPNISDFAGNIMDQNGDGISGDRFTKAFSIVDVDGDPDRREWE